MRGKIGTLLAAVAAAAGAAGAAKWAKGRKDEETRDLEAGGAPAVASADASTPSEPSSAPVAQPTEVPVAAPAEATTYDSGADDLTAIKGLGKVKAARLAEAGIISFAQVAAWTDDDISEVGLKVNTSPGQIKREDWVGQARTLADQ